MSNPSPEYFRRGYSMFTVTPLVMSLLRRTASQLAVRMQPWLWARPIVCGLFVPWMPMPGLFKPIQRTPTGLFGPIGEHVVSLGADAVLEHAFVPAESGRWRRCRGFSICRRASSAPPITGRNRHRRDQIFAFVNVEHLFGAVDVDDAAVCIAEVLGRFPELFGSSSILKASTFGTRTVSPGLR